MKNTKEGFVLILILIVIGIAAIAGTSYHYVKTNQEINTPLNTDLEKQPYVNSALKFTINLPKGWSIDNTGNLWTGQNSISFYSNPEGLEKSEMIITVSARPFSGTTLDDLLVEMNSNSINKLTPQKTINLKSGRAAILNGGGFYGLNGIVKSDLSIDDEINPAITLTTIKNKTAYIVSAEGLLNVEKNKNLVLESLATFEAK